MGHPQFDESQMLLGHRTRSSLTIPFVLWAQSPQNCPHLPSRRTYAAVPSHSELLHFFPLNSRATPGRTLPFLPLSSWAHSLHKSPPSPLTWPNKGFPGQKGVAHFLPARS